MLPALLTIILILIVLALLPYDRPAPVFEDDDLEESSQLGFKLTRQR